MNLHHVFFELVTLIIDLWLWPSHNNVVIIFLLGGTLFDFILKRKPQLLEEEVTYYAIALKLIVGYYGNLALDIIVHYMY